MNLIKGIFPQEETEDNLSEENYYLRNDILLYEPRNFDDAEAMATSLKQGKTAVVNLHNMSKEASQRTIDFLSGVCYSLDGKIEKVGHNLILCTPRNITVAGEITLGE